MIKIDNFEDDSKMMRKISVSLIMVKMSKIFRKFFFHEFSGFMHFLGKPLGFPGMLYYDKI